MQDVYRFYRSCTFQWSKEIHKLKAAFNVCFFYKKQFQSFKLFEGSKSLKHKKMYHKAKLQISITSV